MPESITKLVRAAKAIRAYVTLVRDPNKLGDVFELRSEIADPANLAEMARYFRTIPQCARALDERPRIGLFDLHALAAMPAGTLGQAFGRHMLDAGLDPSALPSLPSNDEIEFMDAHLYETHDIWHVATGFHTDVAGELGLQGFYCAQFPARLALALLSGGLLNTLVDPAAMADRNRRMDAIVAGWTMGRAAKPLFGYRWADNWGRPLIDVQRELGVRPLEKAARHETFAAAAAA